MSDWRSDTMAPRKVNVLGWLRVVWRWLALALVIYSCFVVLLLLRLIEAPLFGRNRPWTPKVNRFASRNGLRAMGIGFKVSGKPMKHKGAVVANHSSWLDILVLSACQEIYFVSKAEVAKWPGIGILAKATGTVFITRKSTEAKRQQEIFEDRLTAGHKLMFFPEGTSTDSIRVLPFKSTLFQAFFSEALYRQLHVQPVTVVYHAPKGEDDRFYGWYGDMSFGAHILKVLSAPRGGFVEVIFHPSVPVDAFTDRKTIAAHCERVIAASHSKAQ